MNDKPGHLRQLVALVKAAVAVIVSGQSDLLIDCEPIARPKARVGRFKSRPPEILAQFGRGGKYFGVYAEIARLHHWTPENVNNLAHGRLQSAPILSSLVRRIEEVNMGINVAAPSLPLAPLTSEELRQFARGGKYYGLPSRVAASLGINRSNVRRTARGEVTSRPALAAIRAEMARVDVELAAKKAQA